VNYLYISAFLIIPILVLVVSYSLCRLIIYISHKKDLLDHPNEFRQHDTPTPYFGGIAIFIALSFGIVAISFLSGSLSSIYFILLLPFFLVGLIDDIFKLSSLPKLILIIIAAALISGWISQLNYISFSYLFLLFVFFTNAFNLLDNIDGLCASTGIAVLAALSIYNFWSLNLIVISAIVGFLILNFPKAKIFMGDSGSLLIGAICMIFTLSSFNSSTHYLNFLPLFWLPLYDTFSVIIVRLNARKSVLIGGKDHFSHRLMKRGMSNLKVITILFFITLAAGTISLFSAPLFSLALFIFIVATSSTYELLTRQK